MSRGVRWTLYVAAMSILLVAAMILSLATGEVSMSISDIVRASTDEGSVAYGILHYIRIPRTLLGLAVGGSLSLTGAILQGIYRNPLVEPYTLGISGGASLGVTFAIVSGLQMLHVILLPLAGFLGALATMIAVYTLSIRRGALDINRMLLTGVMISFVASSSMMFLMSIAAVEEIHGIVFWTMGSLGESNMVLIATMMVVAVICLAVSYVFVTPLNALRLGQSKARHLGIDTDTVIRIMFVVTSLLTGMCIAVAGIIGFVGLVVPHIMRRLVGSDYRILLIASFVCGGIFLIICDVLARIVVSPNELPIGVITGLVGGVAFIVILSRSKKKRTII